MGLAGRRACAEAVRVRRRSVRGRPAPRDRHRSSHGLGRPFRHAWGGRVRRTTAWTGSLPDGPNRGRLVGHVRPPGLDRVARRHSGRRGRRRRHDRPERRARGGGAVCPSGYPAHRGPQRLRRSADASASQAGAGAGAAGPGAVTGAAAGSAGDGSCCQSVTLNPAARASGRVESTCPATIRCDASARDSACNCETDAEAAGPCGVGSACSARAVPGANRSCAEFAHSTFNRAPDTRAGAAGAAGRPGRAGRRDASCDAGGGSAAASPEADAAGPALPGRPRARWARRRRPATPTADRRASVRPTLPP